MKVTSVYLTDHSLPYKQKELAWKLLMDANSLVLSAIVQTSSESAALQGTMTPPHCMLCTQSQVIASLGFPLGYPIAQGPSSQVFCILAYNHLASKVSSSVYWTGISCVAIESESTEMPWTLGRSHDKCRFQSSISRSLSSSLSQMHVFGMSWHPHSTEVE